MLGRFLKYVGFIVFIYVKISADECCPKAVNGYSCPKMKTAYNVKVYIKDLNISSDTTIKYIEPIHLYYIVESGSDKGYCNPTNQHI